MFRCVRRRARLLDVPFYNLKHIALKHFFHSHKLPIRYARFFLFLNVGRTNFNCKLQAIVINIMEADRDIIPTNEA